MQTAQFFTQAHGDSSRKAFYAARAELREKLGSKHTGTLADKELFTQVYVRKNQQQLDPFVLAKELIQAGNKFAANDGEMCACLVLGDKDFLFFGVSPVDTDNLAEELGTNIGADAALDDAVINGDVPADETALEAAMAAAAGVKTETKKPKIVAAGKTKQANKKKGKSAVAAL